MQEISFPKVFKRLDKIKLPNCEVVVGIAEGGTVPAALVASRIGCNLKIIKFNYRNKKNIPRHVKPILLSKVCLPKDARNILLIDDVSISGKTLNAAKKLFKDYQVKTLVLRGKADYVLFPEINRCVKWPWQR